MNPSADHAASEVLEEYAEGDLKGIFEDVKKTFRAPTVGVVFATLATQPDYLRVAWRQLHTNAQTVYFETQANEIRRFAVESMSELGEVRTPARDEGIASVLGVFHYLNPKLMLAISALRSAMLGQLPRITIVPGPEKRQVVPGIAAGMPPVEFVDADTEDQPAASIFREIKAISPGGRVNGEYRALAHWPDFLEGAWKAVEPRMSTPEYTRATRRIRWMADEAVLGLPFRMEATPHTLRHAGLTETQIDAVGRMLDELCRSMAQSVANVALFSTGIEGKSGALETRYPVTLV